MEEQNKVSQESLNPAPDTKSEPSGDTTTPPPHSSAGIGISDEGIIFYAYLILLFVAYGFLSFIYPELFSRLWENPVGTLGILTFGFVSLLFITKLIRNLSRSSFVEIDRKARGELTLPTKTITASMLNSAIKRAYANTATLNNKAMGEPAASSITRHNTDKGKLSGHERPLGTAFELYICNVVESLDKHISLTEEKGSNLLDRGLLFLFGGIVFYVAAIAGWQLWAKYGEPKDHIMYIGMFASSVVFLVCEFLAAWFLKQYRHYVDASLACLRVKSVYDRYLLSYYAIKEIEPEADGVSEKLNRVLEAIKEDVMWPEHKDNLANDFNYMLESMTSIHASLDKLKGLFESKAKPGKGK